MDSWLIAPDNLVAFTTVSLLLCAAPGPDNLFVLAQSALYGRFAGLRVTLGLCTGLVFHTAAVALGIAALIQATPAAFMMIKYFGAAYLFWLAWQAWRTTADRLAEDHGAQPGGWQLYRRGILMNITNPKVTLFFLALLPQFADTARGPMWLQVAILGLVFIASTLLVFGLVAMLAGSIGRVLRERPRVLRLLHIVAGILFAGLAIRLLLAVA